MLEMIIKLNDAVLLHLSLQTKRQSGCIINVGVLSDKI